MATCLFGLDLSTHQIIASHITDGRPVVAPDEAAAPGGARLWDATEPSLLEAEVMLALRELRDPLAHSLELHREAVLCVPSHVDDATRDALVHAATSAGFTVIRCISPPEALAVIEGVGYLSGVTVTASVEPGHIEAGAFRGNNGKIEALSQRSDAHGDPRRPRPLDVDDAIERVVALIEATLEPLKLAPDEVARILIAGRQEGLEEIADLLDERWGVSCTSLDPSAAAQGAAVAAFRAQHDAPPRSVPSPSSIPPPASIPPPTVVPPPSVAPAGEAPVGSVLPRQGRFELVHTARALLAMPVARPASSHELSHTMMLPALIAQVGMRPHLTGLLRIKGDGETLHIGLHGGAPVIHPGDRQRILRAFAWSEGTYDITAAQLPGLSMAIRESSTGLVTAGVRRLVRDLAEAQLFEPLSERRELAPTFIPEREGRLRRMHLSAAEERLVPRLFDGAHSLDALLNTTAMSQGGVVQLTFLLQLFEIVRWQKPVGESTVDKRAELALRVDKMSSQNPFEVLFVHWSVGHAEVVEAWRKFQAEYGPSGKWHAVDPALARAAMQHGTRAWSLLSDDASRLSQRRSSYPHIDPEIIAPMVEGRARALSMAQLKEEEQDMLRLLRELNTPAPPPKR